jgi:hypothetical protein
MLLEDAVRRINSFEAEAHRILAVHEAAPSRAVLLDGTYKELRQLSLQQDELLRQALRCVENNLYRASHILAWTALVDLIQNILSSDNFKKLNAVRTNWKITSLEQLQDEINEFQLIEACKDVKLISKPEMRMLQGFLSKRNLCAHPSDFFPDFNQTLGYMADILNMIKKIQSKKY